MTLQITEPRHTDLGDAGEVGMRQQMKMTRPKTLTDKHRNLQTGVFCLFIGLASLTNVFTHNRFGVVTVPVAFGSFAYVCFINLKRQ